MSSTVVVGIRENWTRGSPFKEASFGRMSADVNSEPEFNRTSAKFNREGCVWVSVLRIAGRVQEDGDGNAGGASGSADVRAS
jgi:hypothetical protein